MDPTEYKVAARETRPTAGSPGSIKTGPGHRRKSHARKLDTDISIQGCVRTLVGVRILMD
jgi:hypothetical protein